MLSLLRTRFFGAAWLCLLNSTSLAATPTTRTFVIAAAAPMQTITVDSLSALNTKQNRFGGAAMLELSDRTPLALVVRLKIAKRGKRSYSFKSSGKTFPKFNGTVQTSGDPEHVTKVGFVLRLAKRNRVRQSSPANVAITAGVTGTTTTQTTIPTTTSTMPAGSCGDGHLDAGEECDPPGTAGCEPGCHLAALTCDPPRNFLIARYRVPLSPDYDPRGMEIVPLLDRCAENVDLSLSPPHQLALRLVDAAGEEVADEVSVSVHRTFLDVPGLRLGSVFGAEMLADGEYEIGLEPGCQTGIVPGPLQAISIAGGNVSLGDVVVPRHTVHRIAGTVSGLVPGVRNISAIWHGSAPGQSCLTSMHFGSNGAYEVYVPAGMVTLEAIVQNPEYVRGAVQTIRVTGDTTVDLPLAATISVRGSLVGPGQVPIVDAQVWLDDVRGEAGTIPAITDATGAFSVRVLPNRDYAVLLEPPPASGVPIDRLPTAVGVHTDGIDLATITLTGSSCHLRGTLTTPSFTPEGTVDLELVTTRRHPVTGTCIVDTSGYDSVSSGDAFDLLSRGSP